MPRCLLLAPFALMPLVASVSCVSTEIHPETRLSRAAPTDRAPSRTARVQLTSTQPVEAITVLEHDPARRSVLEVRLRSKLARDQLGELARTLREQVASPVLLVAYYLPGMTLGAGAWATTHYEPELEIDILGLPIEAESRLVSAPPAVTEPIVGRWIDDRPQLGSVVTIAASGERGILVQQFPNGVTVRIPIDVTPTSLGPRYDAVTEAPGHFWVLDSGGQLFVWDEAGPYASLRPVDDAKPLAHR